MPGVPLPFADRAVAGRLLAERLAREPLPAGTVVLAIPRGGVPVAAEVARRLGLALDLVVVRKVGAPGNPEFAVGAVAADGTSLVEPWAGEEPGLSVAALDRAVAAEAALAREQEDRLRPGRAPLSLKGATAIVIDDGIATGATTEVAVAAARRAGAGRTIVAVPVAPPHTVDRLRRVADAVIALAEPPDFYAVGQWYLRFEQVDDASVIRALADADRARRREGGAP